VVGFTTGSKGKVPGETCENRRRRNNNNNNNNCDNNNNCQTRPITTKH
jgi:hypothetical protein